MSYILEALRRAESERERKRGVPGLYAQPVPSPASEEGGERRGKPWRWIAVGVAAGVLLPVAWRLWSGDPTPPDDTALSRAPVAGNVTAQANAPAEPAAAVPAPAEPASAAAAAEPNPVTTSAAPTTTPTAKPPPKAQPKHAPATKPASPDAAHPAAVGMPSPTADGSVARPH